MCRGYVRSRGLIPGRIGRSVGKGAPGWWNRWANSPELPTKPLRLVACFIRHVAAKRQSRRAFLLPAVDARRVFLAR